MFFRLCICCSKSASTHRSYLMTNVGNVFLTVLTLFALCTADVFRFHIKQQEYFCFIVELYYYVHLFYFDFDFGLNFTVSRF